MTSVCDVLIQLGLTVIGGFLGYLGAIWSVYYLQKKEKKEDIVRRKREVLLELQRNIKIMEGFSASHEQTLYYSPYLDFQWICLSSNDDIQLIDNDANFEKIVYAYRLISELNALENMRSELFYQNQLDNFRTLSDAISQKRNEFISYANLIK